MPSTLFPTMERPHADEVGQDQTLQMALNLSMLGLQSHVHSEDEGASTTNTFDENGRRSSNMTECVPVPSSEHVAEIVGRQGCKIKALRAKTNTYIKTPVRGEDPTFVVTGRKEDVAAAKREILSAADHFSQIRARRNNQVHGTTINGTQGGVNGSLTVPNLPGQTTIHVKVPYRVVGLVVGPKGSTVKRIQQQTNTYIITPSRDNQPVFVVTGMPENVERAREEIEAHIAMRTGGLIDSTPEDDFASNGTDTGLFSNCTDMSMFNKPPPSTSASISALSNIFNPMVGGKNDAPRSNSSGSESNYFFPNTNGNGHGTTKLSEFNPLPSFPTNGFLFNDCPSPDLGIDSPGFDPPGLQSAGVQSLWHDLTRCSSSLLGLNPVTTQHQAPRRSSSVGSSDPAMTIDANANEHPPARRIRSDPLEGGLAALPSFVPLSNANAFGSSNSAGSHGSSCSSPTDSLGSSSAAKKSKECVVCFTSEVVAALVPCGHNMFCMECANRLVETTDGECPVCQTVVTQAIRIIT